MAVSDDASRDKIDRLIDQVDQLHSSPHVACKVLELLQDRRFEMGELVRCLEADPALTSRILQLVNSSYFGLRDHVSSLQQAIVYLGSRSLRLLVISFGLLDTLTRGAPAQVYDDFWRRSLAMAAGSSRLCAGRRGVSPYEAQTAGLLADLGVLVLVQGHTADYVPLYEGQAHGRALVEAERERFGFDHAQVGARLLARWNLPQGLVAAAARHHQQEEDGEYLELAVRAASLLADALWDPETAGFPEAKRFLNRCFHLDLDGLITLAVDCQDKISEYVMLFQAGLPAPVDCETMLQRARKRYQIEALQAAVDLDGLAMLDSQRPSIP